MPKLTAFFDKAVFVNLCILIVLLPFSTAAVETFSTLAILFFLFRCFSEGSVLSRLKSLRQHDLFWPAVVFILATLLSVAFSEYKPLSGRAFISKFSQALLTLAAAATTIRSHKRVKWFLGLLSFSVCVVLFDAGWQFFTGKDLFKGYDPIGGNRLRINFPHSNDFGAYLCLVCVLFLGMTLGYGFFRRAKNDIDHLWSQHMSRWVSPKTASVLFVLIMIVLGLTYSRSAWIGTVIGFFGIAYFFRYMKVTMIASVLFGIVFIPMIFMTRPDLGDKLKLENVINISGRDKFWGEAVSFFKSAPVTGTGLNTYAKKIEELRNSREGKYNWAHGYYAHNCYLQMLAETGVLGLGAFLWFLVAVMGKIGAFIHQKRDHYLWPLVVSLYFGLIAFLVECFFDTSLYSSQLSIYFWLMLGVCLALKEVHPPVTQDTQAN